MEKRENVLYENMLLREIGFADARPAQRQDHGQHFEAVRVDLAMLRDVVSLLHSALLTAMFGNAEKRLRQGLVFRGRRLEPLVPVFPCTLAFLANGLNDVHANL